MESLPHLSLQMGPTEWRAVYLDLYHGLQLFGDHLLCSLSPSMFTLVDKGHPSCFYRQGWERLWPQRQPSLPGTRVSSENTFSISSKTDRCWGPSAENGVGWNGDSPALSPAAAYSSLQSPSDSKHFLRRGTEGCPYRQQLGFLLLHRSVTAPVFRSLGQ